MEITEILKASQVIPVVTITDIRHAIPIAEALLAGGITIMEITLRTNVAVDVIRSISRAVPEMIVGAGTLVDIEQFAQLKAIGAHFAVSPGLNHDLIAASRRSGIPYLPAVMTPSEIMSARALGFSVLKFFPAESAGGAETLKQLQSIFPYMQFCPTGGITRQNMDKYLALRNVIAVGGSWLTPKELLEAQDWDSITLLAKQICQTNN